MYRADPKIIQIELERLSSHDESWQVDCRLNLTLRPGEWADLDITDTLDYGALAGQIRFILDAAADPATAIGQFEPLLPRLFPRLTITGQELTITRTTPRISTPGHSSQSPGPLWLGTAAALAGLDITAAVLVCTGAQSGTWYLSPYFGSSTGTSSSAATPEPAALCLAMPYSGYLATGHFKADYYHYPPS